MEKNNINSIFARTIYLGLAEKVTGFSDTSGPAVMYCYPFSLTAKSIACGELEINKFVVHGFS